MCDVYLGGFSGSEWREELKTEISEDISIFDPISDDYDSYYKSAAIANDGSSLARELFYIDNSKVVAFYLNSEWNDSSSLLELADAVSGHKYVIVCLDGQVQDMNKIKRYCNYRGVLLAYSLEELITNIEEYIAQIDLCKNHDFI